MTVILALSIAGMGALAGSVGALLGIGGGVFLVPLLNLAAGFPLPTAAAISLLTMIATSSAVSAGRAGTGVINLRLGMILEVATVAGSVVGGLTAHVFAESTLQRIFGTVALIAAGAVLSRINQRNVIVGSLSDVGVLDGRFYEDESGALVAYRVRRLPVALAASFVAGHLSTLLGIGGGIIKVPVLNTWCGVPLRAAAATSAFMIGVTATTGALIYYGRGTLPPLAAAPAVLGVQLGSWIGLHVSNRVPAKWLKALLAGVLVLVAVLMFVRSS